MTAARPIGNLHTPRQQGFVLIVALILLLVLTILGLAAAQSTSLEERMAGNSRNQDLAFQAAEAGLRAAEDCLNSGQSMCAAFSSNTAGTYLFNPSAPPPPSTNTTPLWMVSGFWNNSGYVLKYDTVTGTSIPDVLSQPEFIIEKMPPVAIPGGNLGTQQYGGGSPSIELYRITSYGIGGDSSATAMLQSTYEP